MLRLQTLPLGYDKAMQHKKLCLRVVSRGRPDVPHQIAASGRPISRAPECVNGPIIELAGPEGQALAQNTPRGLASIQSGLPQGVGEAVFQRGQRHVGQATQFVYIV